jgi:hypothetical protein
MEKKEVKEIPYVYYLYLHSKIWDMSKGQIISEKDLKKYLYQWKIPEKLRPLIIKELILMKLISQEKQYFLRIERPEFKEEEINRYYELLGFF